MSKVKAQTLDPSVWQKNATSLKTQTHPEKKTAGLMMTVQVQNWPFLSLQGGVQFSGWNMVSGPIGVELGLVKIPEITSSTFSQESADWSYNEMVFNANTSSPLKIIISRLTPAILIQTQSSKLRLFSGNVNTYTETTTQVFAPSYLKYLAYSNAGSLQIKAIPASSSIPLNLPDLDNNWLMVWYGANSHFRDTKIPILFPYPLKKGCCDLNTNVPNTEAYQADVLILMKFENNPISIVQSPEGGIDLNFSSNTGYITLLPLLGIEHPKATDTEKWGVTASLPADLLTKINFWLNHLCFFPKQARETYQYDTTLDKAIISEEINFLSVCKEEKGVKLAPIPPFLALAKDRLPINFSENLVEAHFPTEFGPIWGIENTNFYSWSLQGLRKYTNSQKNLKNEQVPSDLLQILNKEVDKIVSKGHFAPWIYADKWSMVSTVGDIYWLNPAETLFHLIEVLPVLPENQKNNLINYLKAERTNYPPEIIFNLPLYQGVERQEYSVPDHKIPGNLMFSEAWQKYRPEIFSNRVWLYNFYSLSQYYEVLGENFPSSLTTAVKNTLDQDMAEQDWATFYWFENKTDRKVAVINSNRHLAGLIGAIKIFSKTGDSHSENLSRALFAKAVVLRIAMTLYPNFLYNYNLVNLPPDPAWQVKYIKNSWITPLFNYNWTAANDDVRQVITLNQFGLRIMDNSGFMPPFTDWQAFSSGATNAYLVIFKDIVPETSKLLADYVKNEVEQTIQKVEAILPHWYNIFADAIMGIEHGTAYPTDAYQIFLAKAWIQRDSAENLASYLDIPYLLEGDLFYIHKVAEAIKAYRGWEWSEEPLPPACAGDMNGDKKRDFNDLKLVLAKYATSCLVCMEDINKDGKINSVDLLIILKSWNQSCP